MSALLQIEGLGARYGDFQALFDVSFEIAEGELFALVGANGAGKSTTMQVLSGAIRASAGQVRFGGRDITAMPDFERARLGIGLVPEGRRLFPTLSVEENLLVGAATRRRGPWDLRSVYAAFPLLQERRRRTAANLSGGEQQMVAIGRALMGNPQLILMDEVSLGLAPIVVDQVYACLPAMREAGATVLLVEQDLSRTLAVADRVACMLEGRLVLAGSSTELTREAVTEAYFGVRARGAH